MFKPLTESEKQLENRVVFFHVIPELRKKPRIWNFLLKHTLLLRALASGEGLKPNTGIPSNLHQSHLSRHPGVCLSDGSAKRSLSLTTCSLSLLHHQRPLPQHPEKDSGILLAAPSFTRSFTQTFKEQVHDYGTQARGQKQYCPRHTLNPYPVGKTLCKYKPK